MCVLPHGEGVPGHSPLVGTLGGVMALAERSLGGCVAKARQMIKREELLRFLIAGYSLPQIAEAQGCGVFTLRRMARSPEFIDLVREKAPQLIEQLGLEAKQRREQMLERLDEIAWKALDRLEEMIEDENTSEIVAFKAVQDALDRVPEVSRSKRVETSQAPPPLDPNKLLEMALVAREEDRARGVTIEGQ